MIQITQLQFIHAGCDQHRYSSHCNVSCSPRCKNQHCDAFSGSCIYGCSSPNALSPDCGKYCKKHKIGRVAFINILQEQRGKLLHRQHVPQTVHKNKVQINKAQCISGHLTLEAIELRHAGMVRGSTSLTQSVIQRGSCYFLAFITNIQSFYHKNQ